ncbi:hypothetical protein LCGC14_1227120 [marine sediment metagenome]|uniref:Uncharacterized protein n=1 Tax=marine sediment metagenome TaxID=412755 RepID=A0A0F9L9I3_9ZZZZ
MDDPWEKAYVYARPAKTGPAHIQQAEQSLPLCGAYYDGARLNRTPKPYPVCRNCLRTKRAKELGL